MIIGRKTGVQSRSKNMYNACHDFAKHVGVSITENKDKFTVTEAHETSAEEWFPINNMSIADYSNFIELCISFSSFPDLDRVPIGKVTIKIDCPVCHKCEMTCAQLSLNKYFCEDTTFIICNNCGAIMRSNTKEISL